MPAAGASATLTFKVPDGRESKMYAAPATAMTATMAIAAITVGFNLIQVWVRL